MENLDTIQVEYTEDYWNPVCQATIPGGYFAFYNGQKIWGDTEDDVRNQIKEYEEFLETHEHLIK